MLSRTPFAPVNSETEHISPVAPLARNSECDPPEVAASAAFVEQLFEARERAQVTLDSIGDAVACSDLNHCITYLNVTAEKMSGWSNDEAYGRPLHEVLRIIDATTRHDVPNPMIAAMLHDEVAHLDSHCVLIRRDGKEADIEDSAAPIHDRHGNVSGAVMVFHDVTAAREMSARMSHLASHDSLTNLPNRILFSDRLTQAISTAQRREEQLAVLFIDVDRFKHINDSFGHAIGDQLLQVIAQRLRTCVRGSDTVSRHGGDEFVILLSEITQAHDAAAIAEKILAALHLPCHIEGRDVFTSVSIGISTYPEDGTDAEMLMEHADLSMYMAKEDGRNNYQFFKAHLNELMLERNALENDLHHALQCNELKQQYQLQINLLTGAIVGVEALMRWQHPQRGLISPSQFIPIAEESGSIVALGKWMLREACHQAYQWQCAGLEPIRLAINVSTVELRSRNFVAWVRETLLQTRLQPQYLELELTETFLMQEPKVTAAVLRELKQLGVQLALDDFGTGYSSLSYLRSFPIDTLKIDKSFVRSVLTNADDASIISAVISMGNSLRMRVVAEGIETRGQLDFLTEHGCRDGQGLFFSEPVSADECARLMRAGAFAAARYSRAKRIHTYMTADMFEPRHC